MATRLSQVPREFWFDLDRESQRWFSNLTEILNGTIKIQSRKDDPPDPVSGESIIWQSSGDGSGDSGDIMIKITDAAGTTKTVTLVDFSGV